MKAPIRQIIEALDGYLHFLPDADVRQGREHRWLQAPEVAEQLRHYGAWVNFWGVCCGLVALLVPGLMLLQVSFSPHQLPVSVVSVIRFILCFPAVMLAVKFAGDLFICAAANLVQCRVHASPAALVVPGTAECVCLVLRRSALLGSAGKPHFVSDGCAGGMRGVLSGLNQPLRWMCRMLSAMFLTVSSSILER